MSGGGGQPTTQVTKQELSPEQEKILGLAMPGVEKFAATVPQRYGGSTVAGFDPLQTAGQNSAVNAAGAQGTVAAGAAGAENNLLTNIWDPSQNPNLKGAIDSAVRPIQENLTQSTLPAIRGEAVSTGNFGSSRQGIAEGLASQGASRQIGDTSAKVAEDLYGTNIDAQLKALGLAPTVQGAQVAPATTLSGVGDVKQNMAQQLLGQDVSNFNYDQLAPFLQSQELISLLGTIPGGSTVTTGNAPTTNPAMSALGGAAAGASLGSALLPGVGTGIGAGAGALLPFLFH